MGGRRHSSLNSQKTAESLIEVRNTQRRLLSERRYVFKEVENV